MRGATEVNREKDDQARVDGDTTIPSTGSTASSGEGFSAATAPERVAYDIAHWTVTHRFSEAELMARILDALIEARQCVRLDLKNAYFEGFNDAKRLQPEEGWENSDARAEFDGIRR